MHSFDQFQTNDGYMTYSVYDRYVITKEGEDPDRPWRGRQGFNQWRVGDHVSLHLDIHEKWTLMEVVITAAINHELYRVTVEKFDGTLQSLGHLSIGDNFPIHISKFFSVWGPDETRQDGEGNYSVYHEGSTRRKIICIDKGIDPWEA